jgi:hypothetical protein
MTSPSAVHKVEHALQTLLKSEAIRSDLFIDLTVPHIKSLERLSEMQRLIAFSKLPVVAQPTFLNPEIIN